MRLARPHRRRFRLHATLAAVLCCALVPASVPRLALAQKSGPSAKELEEAKKKFFEGMDLEQQGKWGEALKRFQDVAKVRMTPQVRFHIALCEEHEGQLIEALRDFEAAESDAKASVPKVDAVAKEAPEHATAIKTKIPKLRLKMPAGVENVSVTVDGNAIDAKDDVPLNPGNHKVEATADKMHPYSQELKLEESETKSLTLKFVPLDGSKKEEEPPPPKKEEDTTTPKPSGGGVPTAALVVGGLGVAALVGSGVFYLMRNGAKNELETTYACKDLSCPPEAEDTVNKGRTYNTLSNVFGIVGLVGVGAGVVLWITAPKGDAGAAKPSTSLRLVPNAPGANVAGLSFAGVF